MDARGSIDYGSALHELHRLSFMFTFFFLSRTYSTDEDCRVVSKIGESVEIRICAPPVGRMFVDDVRLLLATGLYRVPNRSGRSEERRMNASAGPFVPRWHRLSPGRILVSQILPAFCAARAAKLQGVEEELLIRRFEN